MILRGALSLIEITNSKRSRAIGMNIFHNSVRYEQSFFDNAKPTTLFPLCWTLSVLKFQKF